MELYVLDTGLLRGREEELLPLLSPQRREKAERLRGESRLRSLAGGLLLRRYVGEGPFSLGPQGKPRLPGGAEFSLSHSGALAVLAVNDTRVGADAERIAPVREALRPRVLTAEERRWTEEDPERRFAFLWTRKEAVLKYLGCGITRPLAELCVLPGAEVRPEGEAVSLHTTEYQGYMISAAAAEDAFFTPAAVTAEDLLYKEETQWN
ncbi:MAG: 4'-phosphopantetheinyl transferase superfamily protein [Oscillospiraceae bacterium]|nr:4'-phosphopantetheinyl transferase superfamily protein [Oscillospiraceae bacterium]